MNKIGWCSETWNPVIGCKNNCSYCYAKRINDRFKFIENWNIPEWREKSFNKKLPKKPQRIFVGSMSEIYYWDEVWIQKVIDKTKQYPQHTFQFLTKHPRIYYGWAFPPENCWLGITVTGEEEDIRKKHIFASDNANLEYHNIKFISFEPLLQKIYPEFMAGIDWVICGAETGKRRGKVIPKKEWVEDMVDYCRDKNIPIYLKDSLKSIYPTEIKEFPAAKKIILQNNKNMLK